MSTQPDALRQAQARLTLFDAIAMAKRSGVVDLQTLYRGISAMNDKELEQAFAGSLGWLRRSATAADDDQMLNQLRRLIRRSFQSQPKLRGRVLRELPQSKLPQMPPLGEQSTSQLTKSQKGFLAMWTRNNSTGAVGYCQLVARADGSPPTSITKPRSGRALVGVNKGSLIVRATKRELTPQQRHQTSNQATTSCSVEIWRIKEIAETEEGGSAILELLCRGTGYDAGKPVKKNEAGMLWQAGVEPVGLYYELVQVALRGVYASDQRLYLDKKVVSSSN